MDTAMFDALIKSHTMAIRERLERAAGIARAAEACAQSGGLNQSLDILLDIEELSAEATTLLNAMCVMRRMPSG